MNNEFQQIKKNDDDQRGQETVHADLTEKDIYYREKILKGSMLRVVLYIGIPLALFQSLNQLFAILDTMMASHISPTSVSAVAYLTQINFLLSAIGGGLATGAGIQISRAYGEGDFMMVKKRISSIYTLCLVIGLLLLVVIFPFAGLFLKLAGTPAELITEGVSYFRIQLIVMVFTFLNNIYIAVERARGYSKRILYLNLSVIVSKLSLTAIFVYVFKCGLEMIAAASLISQLILFAFAIKNSIAGDNAFGFSKKCITVSKDVNLPMIKTSIPIIMEKMLFASGKTVVNSMCNVYGPLMVGAMGVSNNLGGITTNPQNGFQDGTSAIISQNFGAKNYKRVLSAFYSTVLVNVIMSTFICGITVLNLNFFSHLFDGGDPEFQKLIISVYKFEAVGGVPLGVFAAVMAMLYGLGKTRLTMVLNVSRIFVFRIPVFWFLQHFTSYGEKSVGIVMMVSNVSVAVMAIVTALIVIPRYKKQYM
ncbi:MAG: MATE family efflux transporter [Eubacterium sp.]|nr:MATE family efflux transporter [Eubacterium sp.]MBR6217012.1 MATE family efflux transporter [Eubacterium sp.]